MANYEELEKILSDIIQSNTTENNGVRESHLGKRELFTAFRQKLKDSEMLPVGAYKFRRVLLNLWKTGRVYIMVNGVKIKNLSDKSLQGKKWEVVASELSEQLKHQLLALAIGLDSLHKEIKKLKETEKLSPMQFVNYIQIKHRILSDPFSFYLGPATESGSIRAEMLNFAMKYIVEIVPDLKIIEKNQEKHYPGFSGIIMCLEKIIEKKGKIWILSSLDSKSNTTKIQCRDIEKSLKNIKNELKYHMRKRINNQQIPIQQ